MVDCDLICTTSERATQLFLVEEQEQEVFSVCFAAIHLVNGIFSARQRAVRAVGRGTFAQQKEWRRVHAGPMERFGRQLLETSQGC